MKRHFRIDRIRALAMALCGSGLLAGLATTQGRADGIPDGYMIIEGDIIVPKTFYERGGIGTRSASGDTAFWPNGNVPFVFDANVSVANQNLMLAAMVLWENVANVDFLARNGESDFVRIRDSSGDAVPSNSSMVGVSGGEQIINIVNWGWQFIMAHELGHCLGLWHEQSRPDRDFYVTINWANIEAGLEHNFETRSAADVYPKRDFGLPDAQTYDFDSVMHYDQFAFSINSQPTITVLPPNQAWQTLIGQRTHFSLIDRLTMSFLYPENGWFFVDRTNPDSGAGSFQNPYKEITTAAGSVPDWSTLWIQPGNHVAVGVFDKPVTLEAPLGNVVLGQ